MTENPNPTDIQESMMTSAEGVEEDEKEEEEPGWHSPATGPDREEMAANYLPAERDWPAKTILDVNDPARVAALENWEDLFPSCAHHQPLYDAYLETFLKGRTSVHGESRRDFKAIIRAMFGGGGEAGSGSFIGLMSEDLYDD